MADGKTPRKRRDDDDQRDNARDNQDDRRRDETAESRRRYEDDNRYTRSNTSWIWPLLLLLLILLGGWYLLNSTKKNNGNIYNVNQNQQNQNQGGQDNQNEQKTSNFTSSTPNNAETLPAAPSSVIVQTSTPSQVQNSSITITNNNQDYGTGDTLIGNDGRSLRRTFDPNAPEGTYVVTYKTCGTDGNCQTGKFQFKIDKSNTSGYEDQRNKATVNITFANDKFYPENVLVSKGTRVTWNNDSSSAFAIISGPSGTTNYFSNLNSNSIAPNGSYTFTLSQTGYYPYHTTVNEQTINGRVAVQ